MWETVFVEFNGAKRLLRIVVPVARMKIREISVLRNDDTEGVAGRGLTNSSFLVRNSIDNQ